MRCGGRRCNWAILEFKGRNSSQSSSYKSSPKVSLQRSYKLEFPTLLPPLKASLCLSFSPFGTLDATFERLKDINIAVSSKHPPHRCHYPQSKETASTMTNTEDQPSSKDDLAAKVDKLNKDLETFEDDDIEAGDDDNKKIQGPHYPFKVEARIDIPTYDGTVDAEKLDSWIIQLETYFILYGFSSIDKVVFARLKLMSHALAWWNSQLKTRGQDVSWKEFTRLLRPHSNEEFTSIRGITGHTKEECWKVHPELFPKKWIKDDQSGKRTTATDQVNDVVELESVQEPDKSLFLMTKQKEKSLNTKEQPDKKEELFTLHIQVKQELIEAVVDTGSQKNLISAGLVQRLGLITTPHHCPYSLGWIQKDMDTHVNKQYGEKYLVNRNKVTRNVEFTTACQARRLVNASQVVLLSLVRPMENANKVSALSHINNQHENVIAAYPTVFEDVCDMPMNQVSEHDDQLIADSTPPKVGMYRNSALENDEIKWHDRQRVEGNFQEADRH
ncbi:retrovirus-related pol polyprotein from transposon TNT 1-94 [Tanacetum coccineum]